MSTGRVRMSRALSKRVVSRSTTWELRLRLTGLKVGAAGPSVSAGRPSDIDETWRLWEKSGRETLGLMRGGPWGEGVLSPSPARLALIRANREEGGCSVLASLAVLVVRVCVGVEVPSAVAGAAALGGFAAAPPTAAVLGPVPLPALLASPLLLVGASV